jgi:hypothetical protein
MQFWANALSEPQVRVFAPYPPPPFTCRRPGKSGHRQTVGGDQMERCVRSQGWDSCGAVLAASVGVA